MKKILFYPLALMLALGLSACSNNDTPEKSEEPTPVVEPFSAEYEMSGTTSTGAPKNDTFIFEGETTDGIITKLNFDIIRNKGLEGEFSKKTLMGYQMNVSDAIVAAGETGLDVTITMNGFDGTLGQYMVSATASNVTAESPFSELTIKNYTGADLTAEERISVFQYLANEANIELSEETTIADLVAIHGLFKDGAFVEGTNRVSFAGYNGGRSYGEQIDAIVAHILANNMTLEDVYEMFKTVNQQSQPIEERDTVSGATIAFVGDFQRVVYMAIHGEVFEGVINTTEADGSTTVEVATQGFGGEIQTVVVFDAEGKITSISVRSAQETAEYGAKLCEEGSEFLTTLIDNQDDLSKVDTATGATKTAESLVKAVQFAIDSLAK